MVSSKIRLDVSPTPQGHCSRIIVYVGLEGQGLLSLVIAVPFLPMYQEDLHLDTGCGAADSGANCFDTNLQSVFRRNVLFGETLRRSFCQERDQEVLCMVRQRTVSMEAHTQTHTQRRTHRDAHTRRDTHTHAHNLPLSLSLTHRPPPP